MFGDVFYFISYWFVSKVGFEKGYDNAVISIGREISNKADIKLFEKNILYENDDLDVVRIINYIKM